MWLERLTKTTNNFSQESLYPTCIRIRNIPFTTPQTWHLLDSTLSHSTLLQLIARINCLTRGQKGLSNTTEEWLPFRHCHYVQSTVHCPREKLQTTEWRCSPKSNYDALISMPHCLHWTVPVHFIVHKNIFALRSASTGRQTNVQTLKRRMWYYPPLSGLSYIFGWQRQMMKRESNGDFTHNVKRQNFIFYRENKTITHSRRYLAQEILTFQAKVTRNVTGSTVDARKKSEIDNFCTAVSTTRVEICRSRSQNICCCNKVVRISASRFGG